ncbi:MAG: SDR family NAD(P)-dependent oxidoreductase [Deltaproteobacteria bacterium]|nr:SDR family NAD(P)-dependent oxidoreductase [Deltaproteobacteria bacterium]MBN2670286.1 SDR family NAD(P)-dependent oxidoreductase [Deltaproteobacteria bacterium]
MNNKLRKRYGPWALVAGASEGLGAAFATQLAEAGLNLILVARRQDVLQMFGDQLKDQFHIAVHCIGADLSTPETGKMLLQAFEEKQAGLLIYNAAYSKVGPFIERTAHELNSTVDVNVRGPLLLIHALLPRLIERRGGVVLMSSLSGNQGTSGVAAYAASKAFNSILGQSLWYELRPLGVDVTVCCAGAIRTPGYLSVASKSGEVREAPGTLDAAVVARTALRALGRKPFVIPGRMNRFADWMMTRLLPRKLSVQVMGNAMRELSAANSIQNVEQTRGENR